MNGLSRCKGLVYLGYLWILFRWKIFNLDTILNSLLLQPKPKSLSLQSPNKLTDNYKPNLATGIELPLIIADHNRCPSLVPLSRVGRCQLI